MSWHIARINYIIYGSLSNPVSPRCFATENTSLFPLFLLGYGFFSPGMSLIIFITFSVTNFISTLDTTASSTFIQESINSVFSALSSSVVIYMATFITFSLFRVFIKSISRGLMNEYAHSFYILSSQSISESF